MAELFRVDEFDVSPASLTSAYIGFPSKKHAKIALRMLQGKEVPTTPIELSSYDLSTIPTKDTTDLDTTDLDTFLQDTIASDSAILQMRNLTLPSTTNYSPTLLARTLFPADDTPTHSSVSADDIFITPNTTLIRFPNAAIVEQLLACPDLNTILNQQLQGPLPPGKLAVFAAEREQVFHQFTGPNNFSVLTKPGNNLIVDGDLPPKSFFLSHHSVAYLTNLPSSITPTQLTRFFQPYCVEYRDVVGSVHMCTTTDDRFTGSAYIGFDRPGERHKAFLGFSKHNKKRQLGEWVTMHPVKEKPLLKGRRKIDARPERSEEELLDDLQNWERFVDPSDLRYLEDHGVEKTILDDVFLKIRYQNRSFGALDQAIRTERLEDSVDQGGQYKKFVTMYVQTLKECMTTPNNPGLLTEAMFEQGEEVDLTLFDGPRKFPAEKN
eukprot:CAMPEP_0195530226 /NCGR_PEP_ID=MMETSP0794_2-20130614/33056_1 /TAXON_ID=515487 /ORGANISM="Stephanopyxis turris, Strain CCMP 815" /LENGTH=436 /DNA_ID=CAMNT_0040661695 /DNA_START=135 /DNA_END=1445 /DNA_ORIENTATION=+